MKKFENLPALISLPSPSGSLHQRVAPFISHLKPHVQEQVISLMSKQPWNSQGNLAKEVAEAIQLITSSLQSPLFSASFSLSNDSRSSPGSFTSSSHRSSPCDLGPLSSRSDLQGQALQLRSKSWVERSWVERNFDEAAQKRFSLPGGSMEIQDNKPMEFNDTIMDTSFSSSSSNEEEEEEEDGQEEILKALKCRFGLGPRDPNPSSNLPDALATLLNHSLQEPELLRLAATVTAPSSSNLSLDAAVIEALRRIMSECKRLSEENQGLKNIVDKVGQWSLGDGREVRKSSTASRPSFIDRLMDKDIDPAASFGSNFCAQVEEAEEEIEGGQPWGS